MFQKWGPCIYIGRFLCFVLVFFLFSLSAWQTKLPGFVFPCFSDQSFWVGSQSGIIQPPTHPEFPHPPVPWLCGDLWDFDDFCSLVRSSVSYSISLHREFKAWIFPLFLLSLPLPDAGARLAPGEHLLRQQPKPGSVFWGTPGIFLTADSKPAGSKGYESSLYQGCAAPKQHGCH